MYKILLKRSGFMDGRNRDDVKPGIEVAIVLKKDQRTGALTYGKVKDLLTNSKFHPHGIKVRLTDGQVGRVKEIITKG
jgi:uncharacterized repeat protein (TIGR03833 family)